MAELAAALLPLLTAAGGFAAYALQRRLERSRNLLDRAHGRHVELLQIHQAQMRLADVQAVTEGAVEGGTRVVQAVHYGIAAIPFTLLEAIPATRDTTRAVRTTHNLIAGGVYGGISAVNKLVGKVLRGTGPPVKPPK